MNTIECIKTRRSIRSFSDQKPSHELLEQVVAAAAFTPSWKNTQITRYVFVESEDIKSTIAAQTEFQWNENIIKNAPVLTAVTMLKNRCGYEQDGSFSTPRGDGWQMFDAGAASQTFCLAAHEYGLGTVIMGLFNQKKIEETLQIPEEQELAALIAVGYPANRPEAPKRQPVEQLLTYV